MNVPSAFVIDFYEGLENKSNIELIVFENSAHFPMIEKKRYENLLIDTVLKENFTPGL